MELESFVCCVCVVDGHDEYERLYLGGRERSNAICEERKGTLRGKGWDWSCVMVSLKVVHHKHTLLQANIILNRRSSDYVPLNQALSYLTHTV